jgi:hypothetical protein
MQHPEKQVYFQFHCARAVVFISEEKVRFQLLFKNIGEKASF